MAKPALSSNQDSVAQGDDHMPPLDDDVDIGTQPPGDDVERHDDAPSNDAPAPAEKPISPREQAVLRYRELRAQREAAERGQATPDDVASDDPPGDDDEPPVRERAPVRAQPAPPVASPPVTPEPPPPVATAEALEVMRQMVDEVRALRQQPSPAAPAPTAADARQDDAPAEPPPVITRERLKEIAQRVQIGDDDEGAAALQDFAAELAQAIGARQDQPDIPRAVRAELAQNQLKGELHSATYAFREKYPVLANDEDLREASVRRLNRELRADLVSVGLPAEKVAALDPDDLMLAHQQARVSGGRVRSYADMFDKVGQELFSRISSQFAGAAPGEESPPAPAPRAQPPAPAQTSTAVSDRIDRKRASSAQPRAAGVRSSTQPQKQPETYADYIAKLRRSRGYKN